MINRWDGNTGRVQRLPERHEHRPPDPRPPEPEKKPMPRRAVAPPRPAALPPLFSSGGKSGGLFPGLDGLKRLIPGRMDELETEDIILLLILYLMYRESGDSELLMIMGAMFLL